VPELRALGPAFGVEGEFIEAAPHGNGHINDTYAASYLVPGKPSRYIFQRINSLVFKNPAALMDNVLRVTRHQQSLLAGPDAGRRALRLLTAKDGLPYFIDAEGGYWRCLPFIEGARTYDLAESPAQAREAARAFGAFLKSLKSLGGPRLHESIPHFHDTPLRLEGFKAALSRDAAGRLGGCRAEADTILEGASRAGELSAMLAAGLIPERPTHNDTKLNNVLIDDASAEALCVIDLDTVMPGLAAHDFGDLVRSAAHPAAEDSRDPGQAVLQWDKFEALARGFMEGAGGSLSRAEKESLPLGAWTLAYEQGLRFLGDHLDGDAYYKISRPGQNLDRARVQLALARDIAAKLPAMGALIASL
jgi:hypothetical protein